MSQVLQDIADMAINFERSCGYSLPTFKNISQANSSSSFSSKKSSTRNVQQPSSQQEKPKCWYCQGEHYTKDCPTAPKPSIPPKFKSTKENQCYLKKSYHEKFQDRRQISELCTPANDSGKEFNNFISEFENIMLEDSDDSSAPLNKFVINEVFIEGFHAIYNIQVYNTQVQALFDTGASINALSFRFFSHIQQQVRFLPTSRKVVSADGNSLGPIGEVHLKFKGGKIDFNDVFVILNNLQRDIILGLPWQCNYKIGCSWNRESKLLLTIKNKFLALGLTLQLPNQLVKTKCQCALPRRSITWISVKTPRNIQANNLLKINLDRQLPKGLISLDVLHNIKHKQPQEMLIPLVNVMNTVIKLPKNTSLGSMNKVDNVHIVQSSYSPKHHNVKVNAKAHPSKPLLLAFPNSSSFTTHAHNSDKSAIQLQDANVPLEIQHKLNTKLTNKFAVIISKSPIDFGQTSLIEMDLPTTGPPVSTNHTPYL